MSVHRETDVLIIGGGMAAGWAAIAAAQAGARVVVADKGYMGTSGVTAMGGPNHWWVAPDSARRKEAIARQSGKAQGLGDPEWMARILDLTWRYLPSLAPHYPFGSDGAGGTYYSGVRGSEYMRALRLAALEAGVTVLDHHPATELLRDDEGRIAGARGHALRTRQDWEIRSHATILATGGNAFRSGLIGSHTNTGDGQLMAAEAGVALSGMEFGPSWSISPAWASTRTLPYTGAAYYDADGRELDIPPPRAAGHAHNRALGHAMLAGLVLADLSHAPQALRPILRRIQPFTPAPFERRGIDLFRDRFPVKLFGEGTIRGTGGLDLADAECRTSAPGLFAIGDAATRELVAGANSGGGAVNSAWALSSGRIAGAAAARESLERTGASAPVHGLGRIAIAPHQGERTIDVSAIHRAVDHEIHGYTHVFTRDEANYAASGERLEAIWGELSAHGRATGAALVSLRETAALVAGARWTIAAARGRRESRGLHQRTDYPEATEPTQRQLVSGLDTVRIHSQQAEYA